MNISDLDALREKLQRALDAVDDMSKAAVAGRGGTEPDTFAVINEDIVPGMGLHEVMELTEYLVPERVRGFAVVRDFWAVRVPVADENGEIEGDEIMEFATEAEAQAYVKMMEEEEPQPPAAGAA